jgi:hypothetical protein
LSRGRSIKTKVQRYGFEVERCLNVDLTIICSRHESSSCVFKDVIDDEVSLTVALFTPRYESAASSEAQTLFSNAIASPRPVASVVSNSYPQNACRLAMRACSAGSTTSRRRRSRARTAARRRADTMVLFSIRKRRRVTI